MAFERRSTRENIHMVTVRIDSTTQDLQEKKGEAELVSKKRYDREWAIDLLGKDEQWYDETLQGIEEIKATLPIELDYRERMIKTYRWITMALEGVHLSLPMENDRRYAEAKCIKLILTDRYLYEKLQRWK